MLMDEQTEDEMDGRKDRWKDTSTQTCKHPDRLMDLGGQTPHADKQKTLRRLALVLPMPIKKGTILFEIVTCLI